MAKQAHEVIVKEADPTDAASLHVFLTKVASETEYLSADEGTFHLSVEDLADSLLWRQQTANQLCLVAKLADQVIGVLNISADERYRVNHIGDLFVAVAKDFWGHGLGQVLMEEAIAWAESSGIIRRLELTVQVRNERAVHIYSKYGFEIEGTKKRGAKTKNGEFLDVYLMGRLID